MYEGNAIDYFPVSQSMPEPRAGQVAVIREIDRIFKSGKKLVILEGPVGCGKSAIAMTFAKAFKTSHLITPRKSLQNQYYDDFSDDVVLMKGRGAYPCIFIHPEFSRPVMNQILEGRVTQPGPGMTSCADGPCKNSEDNFQICMSKRGFCPYSAAMEVAQKNDSVVHNLHSFIFQTSFADKFQLRDLLVVDEAHDIEGIVRDFLTKTFTVTNVVRKEEIPSSDNIDEWCDFFLQPRFLPKDSEVDKRAKAEDKEYVLPSEKYKTIVEGIRLKKSYYQNNVIIRHRINIRHGKEFSTSFEFIPIGLGSEPMDLIFSLGEYVILMSGTIYSKETFCKNLGIPLESAHFIRIPSSFPKETRPIYLKPDYQVDTSFQYWNENFKVMIEKIQMIMTVFNDAKGLIHAPSYEAAEQITLALEGKRAMTHGKQDFQDRLNEFYNTKNPRVFVSPVCQQGVDFKGDRARFQIITRVPYLNTSDDFINHKVKNDFPWYNHQALVIFGQQLGRINRSEDDYGATFCLDERFGRFIKSNSSKIPKWVKDAMIWK